MIELGLNIFEIIDDQDKIGDDSKLTGSLVGKEVDLEFDFYLFEKSNEELEIVKL